MSDIEIGDGCESDIEYRQAARESERGADPRAV
jgi:hypothetical protein